MDQSHLLFPLVASVYDFYHRNALKKHENLDPNSNYITEGKINLHFQTIFLILKLSQVFVSFDKWGEKEEDPPKSGVPEILPLFISLDADVLSTVGTFL